jgi:hypothetical protein
VRGEESACWRCVGVRRSGRREELGGERVVAANCAGEVSTVEVHTRSRRSDYMSKSSGARCCKWAWQVSKGMAELGVRAGGQRCFGGGEFCGEVKLIGAGAGKERGEWRRARA